MIQQGNYTYNVTTTNEYNLLVREIGKIHNEYMSMMADMPDCCINEKAAETLLDGANLSVRAKSITLKFDKIRMTNYLEPVYIGVSNKTGKKLLFYSGS